MTCLVGKGQTERPAEAEVELECVSVGVAFAVAGLVELVWGTLQFGYGQ